MDIDNLTIGDAKKLIAMLGGASPQNQTLNAMLGENVIIRTESAGVWFGVLTEKSGDEVILSQARRMWRWWAKESISLSGCALYGIRHDKSKICAPVDRAWLRAIEILPCTRDAIDSIGGAPHVNAE